MKEEAIVDAVEVKVESPKRKLRSDSSAVASKHPIKHEVVVKAKKVKLEGGDGAAVTFGSATAEYTGPFPHLQRPTPEECRVSCTSWVLLLSHLGVQIRHA